MEIVLRILSTIATIFAVLVNVILNWVLPRRSPTYPPITNKLLTKSVSELVLELRQRKVTSEQLVRAYITRIKDVNPSLNAVIEDRFEEAIKEAEHADQLMAKATTEQLMLALFVRYPLLGIPFTVKEAVGVKGLSQTVGSLLRKNKKAPFNGEPVEYLRAAGCIPLLVSANPELCLSFETKTHVNGRTLNPYDLRRTSAGSSGGEGSLNGAGATLFGLAPDISGSIRLPAMFCGVFGHKPTGGLVATKGHYPYNYENPDFPLILQNGPITRFARDLPILLNVMAGPNAEKLKFTEAVETKDIKIYYAYGFNGGLNALTRPPIDFDIKVAITRAVKCFEKGGLATKEVDIKGFRNALEISMASLMSLQEIQSIVTGTTKKPNLSFMIFEIFRSLMGHSLFTTEALVMEFGMSVNAFLSKKNSEKWRAEGESLKKELVQLLGKDGVLFLPTFYTGATCFNTSILNLPGVDYMLIFNVLGFPATHVPMGLDHRGLPIGFQVVAAPYQDKLCLQIAAELEGAFGGWVPPIPNEI